MIILFLCMIYLTATSATDQDQESSSVVNFSKKKCLSKDWSVCPENFTAAETHNNVLCLDMKSSEKASHDDAGTECGKMEDSGLLEIPDKQTQEALTKFLKTDVDQFYWIGLKYDKKKKAYIWASGKEATYLNWAIKPTGSDRDSCVKIDASSGEWTGTLCHLALPYICQYKKSDENLAKLLPQKPKLIINRMRGVKNITGGNEVDANCKAETDVRYTLSLFWEGKDNKHIPDSKLKWEISYSMEDGKTCTRHERVDVRFQATPSEFPESADVRLVCEQHLKSTKPHIECSNKKLCEWSPIIHPKFINNEPKLSVTFHHKPNIVNLGWNIRVTCRACVGRRLEDGNVTTELVMSQTNTQTNGTGGNSNRDIKILPVWQSHATSECGMKVAAIYKIPVTPDIDNARVKCTSYMIDVSDDHPNLTATSGVMSVKEGMSSTIGLHVEFHGSPSVVITGKILHAKCSLCLGPLVKYSRDILNFGLVHKKGGQDRLSHYSNEGLILNQTFNEQDTPHNKSCKTMATAELVLNVASSMQHMMVSCYMNLQEGMLEVPEPVYSLPFELSLIVARSVDLPPVTQGTVPEGGEFLPLLIIGFILFVCLGSLWLLVGGDDEENRTYASTVLRKKKGHTYNPHKPLNDGVLGTAEYGTNYDEHHAAAGTKGRPTLPKQGPKGKQTGRGRGRGRASGVNKKQAIERAKQLRETLIKKKKDMLHQKNKAAGMNPEPIPYPDEGDVDGELGSDWDDVDGGDWV